MGNFLSELLEAFGDNHYYIQGFNIQVDNFEIVLNQEDDEEFAVDVYYYHNVEGDVSFDRDGELTRHFSTKEDATNYSKSLIAYLSPIVPITIVNNIEN